MSSANPRIRLGLLLLGALVSVGAAGATGAEGATVTVGSPLVGSFNTGVIFKEQGMVANTSLADPSANVTSPVAGIVVRWRITGYSSAGPFKLRILRPVGASSYMGVGTSAPQARLGIGTEVFTTDLPIQAGDLIGLEGSSAGDSFPVLEDGSRFSIWRPPLTEGFSAAPEADSADEIGFDALVQPAPQVTLISPASGPLSGGTSVQISGHDFTDVTGVSFGPAAAASFTVASEDLITAVSPPGAAPGPVDIRVAAAGGSSPTVAGDQFTYLADPAAPAAAAATTCKVPKLRHATLKQARKRLKRAGCKLGKVSGPKSRSAKVVRQRPKPGTQLPEGSKVKVKLR
jgi:IPT/TIG domain/PASTA domain